MIKCECKKLSLALGSKSLFRDLSFSFDGPGMIAIEGENGTGKSSLLKIAARVAYANSGEFVMSTGQLSFLSTTSMGLMPDLTGDEHISLLAGSLRISSTTVQEQIAKFSLLPLFEELLPKKVSEYSQGMKQLLRYFLHTFYRPKILLLDEPFLYLSPTVKEFVQQDVLELSRQGLVFITDQKISWYPETKFLKICLGDK